MRFMLVAIVLVLATGWGLAYSPDGADRTPRSVVAALRAQGLPTLVVFDRAPPSTDRRQTGTILGLLSLFSEDHPDYVRAVAVSVDPQDPDDPSVRAYGERWIVYVLDSEARARIFRAGSYAATPLRRVQIENVVVITKTQHVRDIQAALRGDLLRRIRGRDADRRHWLGSAGGRGA